jgi:surfactin synthase thioesterase subunit
MNSLERENEQFTRERVQWYEKMQQPLYDRRHEIEEMRRLAKMSLKPERSSPMKTMRQLPSSTFSRTDNDSYASTFKSRITTEFDKSVLQIADAKESIRSQNVYSQQIIVSSASQMTTRDLANLEVAPSTYLKRLTDNFISKDIANPKHTIMICFPGVGCSYSVFHSLAQVIEEQTGAIVYSVCLPERMERITDDVSPYRLYEIIHSIRDEIVEQQLVSLQPGRKLIFYGHNLGGLIAYEICRSLQRTHYHVGGLIVDSMRSPFRQTMFNFSEEAHGIDDHTISSTASYSEHQSYVSGRSSPQPSPSHRTAHPGNGHFTMTAPPKPYYAQDYQPVRDATLLPTIGSSNSPSIYSTQRRQHPPGLSQNNSYTKQSTSSRSSVKDSVHSSHRDVRQHHHSSGGGYLGAAIHNQSEIDRGRMSPGVRASESKHSYSTLSRADSAVSALSYHEDDNGDITEYEQVLTEERELLPSTLYFLSDKQLQAAMFKLGGLPTILQKRRDFLRKALTVFRHDLKLLQGYFVSPPVIPGIPYVEQQTITQEDAKELLEMPPSMFKLQFAVFSIHADLDPWIQNEEVTAWSLTSSSYDHFIIEEANHFHFQHDYFIETMINLIKRIQAQRENNEGEASDAPKADDSDNVDAGAKDLANS